MPVTQRIIPNIWYNGNAEAAGDSGRSRTSRITDRLAHLAGWMQETPKTWPTAAGLRAQLEGAGLRVSIAPLYGKTPFNNWIIVGSH